MISAKLAQRANAELARRRSHALELAEQRRQEVYALQPRLRRLAEEIRATLFASVAASLDGPSEGQGVQTRLAALLEEQKALLAEMGLTLQDLEPQYACPLCQDTGWVRGTRCQCFREVVCREGSLTLPQAAREGRYDFDSFDLSFYPTAPDRRGMVPRRSMGHILEECRRYAGSFGPDSPSLLFQGKTGLGKTHLSLAIAYQLVQQGRSVLYTSAQGLVDRYERLRFDKSPTSDDEDFVALAPQCDLLILDDLGAEFSNSFSLSVLYNVLNDRLMARKPVLLSTNLEPPQLSSAYGERIASRILCDFVAYTFCGNDIRLEKRKRELLTVGPSKE